MALSVLLDGVGEYLVVYICSDSSQRIDKLGSFLDKFCGTMLRRAFFDSAPA